MLHPSTKKLIDRLSEMTLQRKIDWAQGDTPGTLAYDTEGYRVLLEGEPASLVLCDALGGELDRASIEELGATKHIDGGTYETVMESMRAEASRIARGAEDAIASVLGGLDLDGDGIPDVPAPIELEAAPDGAESESMDDIEDAADELSAAPDIDIEDATGINTLEASGADMDEGADMSAFGEEHLPDVPDLADMSLPDNIENAAEVALSDNAEPITSEAFDDTPDVGQAVANLAEQVNNTQTEAQQGDTASTESGGAAPVIGTNTFLTAFNSFPNSNSRGMILQETVETPVKEDTAEVSDTGTDTTPSEAENNLQAETISSVEALSNDDQAATGFPRPGETLSLSGLTGFGLQPEQSPIETTRLDPDNTQAPIDAADPAPESIDASLASIEERDLELKTDASVEQLAPTEADFAREEGGEVPFPMTEDIGEAEPEAATSPDAPDQTVDEISIDDFQDTQGSEETIEPEAALAKPDIDDIEEAAPAPEAFPEDDSETGAEDAPKPPKRFNPWI